MADVIDMIFGRIDRGTDDRLRTRALDQNQEQFLLQQKLEQERLAVERERMAEAKRQFIEQMRFNTEGRERSDAAAYMQAINTGVARPQQAADTMGAELPNNPLPGNIFMRQGVTTPMAAPGGVGQPGPGIKLGQHSMVPIPYAERYQMDTDLALGRAKQQYAMDEQNKMNEIGFLQKYGNMPQAAAVLATKGGRVGELLFSNPQLLFSVMKAGGNPVADKMLQYMIDYAGSKANADLPDAQAELLKSQARYYNRMPYTGRGEGNPATTVSNRGRFFYGEAVTAIGRRGLKPGTPEFAIGVRDYIMSQPWSMDDKAEALKAIDLQDNFNLGRQDWFNNLIGGGPGAPPATVTSGTPPPQQVQPSAPPQRPQPQAQPQAQPGSAALQYTQPVKPQPNAQGLFPVYRNDGSIDGWVTSDQWDQLMLSKPSGLGIDLWAPFRYMQQADQRRRDEGLRAIQEAEARRRALGIR